jgi:hypothetical protein
LDLAAPRNRPIGSDRTETTRTFAWPPPAKPLRAKLSSSTPRSTLDNYVATPVGVARDLPWSNALYQQMAQSSDRVYPDMEYIAGLEDFLHRAVDGELQPAAAK